MAAGGDGIRTLSQLWRLRMGDRPALAHEYLDEHRER